MKQPRILMVSAEASPWAKSGGLADVLGALPAALAAAGHEVAVVIPRYQKAVDAPAVRIAQRIPIPLGIYLYYVDIWRLDSPGITFFFVDNAGFFGRVGLYGDHFGSYGDNHIRFAALCKAAIEVARRFFPADILHCHDWQAALVPVFLKTARIVDPSVVNAQTLLTIHNLGYQGVFGRASLGEIGLSDSLFRIDALEFWGSVSLLKGGIVYADAISTVSRRYAEEIQTLEYGFGLDGLLRARRDVLSGILNGVDYEQWNPETDPHIAAHYSARDLSGKRACKRDLVRAAGLPETAAYRPLLGVVSRFAGQKGFDLLEEIADELFAEDLSLVVLGSGEAALEALFGSLQERFPNKVSVTYGYDESLAHRIEAGADIFLMPSRYEPCGLNQIYSLRYGTAPVVRATGGLDDTIDKTTGFKFADYNGKELLGAIRAACRAWKDRKAWTALMIRGMRKDFSWTASAAEYSRLYRKLHPGNSPENLIS
jgi:starch synthase